MWPFFRKHKLYSKFLKRVWEIWSFIPFPVLSYNLREKSPILIPGVCKQMYCKIQSHLWLCLAGITQQPFLPITAHAVDALKFKLESYGTDLVQYKGLWANLIIFDSLKLKCISSQILNEWIPHKKSVQRKAKSL